MFGKNFIKVVITSFFISIALSFASSFKVNAFPTGCLGPIGIPSSCQNPCAAQDDAANCYVPDFQCSNARILHPGTDCCTNKCKDNDPGTPTPAEVIKFNIFGTQFEITPAKVPNLINIAISSFLGLVSAYALIRGMYVGAVLRTRATSSEDIAKVNKEIVNMIIGFVLAWSFIFIIQFIGSILGFSVSDLNFTSTGSVITIN
ncbi:MAG: hypothetical protein ACMG57_01895 [Candidatus Dojkabacteria bacterium]